MKKKYLKIVAFSVGICVVTSPVFAGVDIINTLLHGMRSVYSEMEVVNSDLNKQTMNEVYKTLGEKSKMNAIVADKDATVDFDKYAPVVEQELARSVDKGYEGIPEIRSYVQTQQSELSSTDVVKQADTLVIINERLNVSGMEATAKSKDVLASSNKAPDEATAQLNAAANARNLHGKYVQESAQDVQILKREISLNQLQAQLIEATSSNAIANKQHSTPDLKKDTKKDTDKADNAKQDDKTEEKS